MSSYIFGRKTLEQPLFIRFKLYRGYLLLSEGISKDRESGKWEAIILQDFMEYPWLKKSLKEGIRFTLSNHKLIHIKLKRVFIFRRICIILEGTNLKRQQFSQRKLNY